MAVTPFDELNNLGASRTVNRQAVRRSIPYAQFFGEMYIDAEEREKRIDMAEALDDVFIGLFALLATFSEVRDITFPLIYEYAERGYKDAILPFLTAQALEGTTIDNIIANQVRFIVDTTVNHLDDAYYTSEDRAMFIAENQVNMIQNEVNEEEAIANGYTYKRWVSMNDLHVRETHKVADGQEVPIMTPFTVGDYQMMHPCDDSLGAGAEEIVNCRCVVEYVSNIGAPSNGYTFEYQDGYKKQDRNNEIEAARWLQSIIGGNVVMLTESNIDNVRTPDFTIDGSSWEVKNVQSDKYNTIDQRIRHGLTQLNGEKGGLILDFSLSPLNMNDATEMSDEILDKRAKHNIDVILKKGDDYKAIAYKIE